MSRVALLLFLPACSFLSGRLPTESPPLADMEEPLALHDAPDDEAARQALPKGGFTGARVQDARTSLEEMEEEPVGVLVAEVVQNSPAEAAGLEPGDLLLDAQGRPLRWASEWRQVELQAKPGARIEVSYDRAGADRSATIVVAARVRAAARGEARRFREEQRVGVVVRTATEVESRAAGLGPGGGAVIVGLSRGSPWRGAGLEFGDLITAAGEREVAHPQVLLDAIRDAPDGGRLKLRYHRDGKAHSVEAPVTRRAGELKRVKIPLLFSYKRERDYERVWLLLGLYRRTTTAAAWEVRLLWFIRFRGGDADRLQELKQ